jgi:cytochrome c553
MPRTRVRAGEKKAAMCIGCHGIKGYQASFPEVHKVPMISGQGAKYIASAGNAYKKGERKHPTMRGHRRVADRPGHGRPGGLLRAARARRQAPWPSPAPQPSAEVAALLTKKALAPPATARTSASRSTASYPKIAGQHADYLFVALKSYKTEGGATLGRGNGVMAGIAKQFSNAELARPAVPPPGGCRGAGRSSTAR